MVLTLISASIAEFSDFTSTTAIFIGIVTIYKGWLVINNLMDLRFAVCRLRCMMLGYFLIVVPIILIAIFFSEEVRQLTTL